MRVEVDAKINVGVIEVSAKALMGDLSSSFDNLLSSSLRVELEHLRKSSSEALERTEKEVEQWRESAEKAGLKEQDLAAELEILRGQRETDVSALRSESEAHLKVIAKLQEDAEAAAANTLAGTAKLEQRIDEAEQVAKVASEKEVKLISTIADLEEQLEREKCASAEALAEAAEREQKLTQRISEMDATTQDLQQRVHLEQEKYEADTSASRRKEEAAAGRISELEQLLQGSEEETQKLRAAANEDAKAATARIVELEQKLQGAEDEMQKFQAAAEDDSKAAAERSVELEQQLHGSEDEAQKLRAAAEDDAKVAAARIAELDQQLQGSEEETRKLRAAANEDAKAAAARIAELEQQLQGSEKETQKLLAAAEDDAKAVAARSIELEKQLQGSENETQKLRAAAEDEAKAAASRIFELEQQLQVAEEENHKLRAGANDDAKASAATSAELKRVTLQLEASDDELQKLQRAAKENEKASAATSAELERVTQQLKASDDELQKLQRAAEENEKASAATSAELERVTQQLKVSDDELQKLQRAAEENGKASAATSSELQRVRQQLKASDDELQKLKRAAEENEKELRRQFDLEQGENSTRVEDLLTRIAELDAEAATSAANIVVLERQFKKASTEAAAAAQEAARKEAIFSTEISELKASLQRERKSSSESLSSSMEKEKIAAAHINELNAQVVDLRRQLAHECGDKHAEAEQPEERLIADIKEKHAVELCKIRRDHDAAIDRIRELQADNRELRKSLKENVHMPGSCAHSSMELGEVWRERDAALNRIGEQQAELEKLRKTTRETVGRTERTARQFEVKADQATNERIIWQARAEEAQKKAKELSDEVERMRQANSRLETNAADLKTALDAAEMQWAESEKKALDWRRRTQILESEVSQVAQHREAAEADLEEKTREIEQWQEHALTCSVRFSSLEDKTPQRLTPSIGYPDSIRKGRTQMQDDQPLGGYNGSKLLPRSLNFQRGRQEGHLAGA